MRTAHLILLFCLAKSFVMAGQLNVSPEPIALNTPLQSVLHTWPREYLEYVGNRIRLSTCTGVIWIGDDKLVSVGVHNRSLDTYQFDPSIPALSACKNEILDTFQKTPLGQLENIAISKDGSLAAISNNGHAAVHLYTISNAELNHIAEIPKVGWWTHGVRFSREMDYIVYTIFGNPGRIMLFRMTRGDEEIYITPVQVVNTDLFPLHPKGIDFSKDDRFIAVCHAINNSKAPNRISGALAVYAFDRIHGKIDPTPVSVIGTSELLSVPEDLCFSPDGSSILVANHANDTVTVHAFDPVTGKIGESRVLLQNPEAKLSFPHGISISPNGKYLAVTNYGDDTVKIYTLTESTANADVQ